MPGRTFGGVPLLLDPHATAVDGDVVWGESVFGHRFDDPSARNDDDSADAISWYDWDNIDSDLLAFAKTAIGLRRQHTGLHPREYLRGRPGRPTDRGRGRGHEPRQVFAADQRPRRPVEFTVPAGRGTWSVVLTTDDRSPSTP